MPVIKYCIWDVGNVIYNYTLEPSRLVRTAHCRPGDLSPQQGKIQL